MTFAVFMSSRLTTLTAMMNSFQVAMKARIAVVNTPGAASGRITLRNAWPGVQPSTTAASSSSYGICRKNAVSSHTASGSAKLMLGRIMAWYVLIQPMSENTCNSGTTSVMPGNIEVATMIPRIGPLPRKLSRAIAYEARTASTSTSDVVTPATTRLFTSARANPLSGSNAAAKLSCDGGAGSSELENWSAGRRRLDTTIQ